MGDPRSQRRRHAAPLKRWDKERIDVERELVKKYGLRRKKELWRIDTLLRRYRSRAKELIAQKNEDEEKKLTMKLNKLGLISEKAGLDDILSLQTDAVLDRRLQTVIHKNQLANTVNQARQFIVHGHIAVDGTKITTPSYLVEVDEESKITFIPKSSLNSNFTYGKEPQPVGAVKKEEAPAEEKSSGAEGGKDSRSTGGPVAAEEKAEESKEEKAADSETSKKE